ncbi:hypothetical protein JOE40_003603 [Arthrobacter sp. PvP102]|jgi:hypothetical protein|uniref:hypothetical protein n=1 Tax=unclassified Arthrobacter TaxID=235627 RepID=UPI0000526935|nr:MULTISPECIES: hypothetical protein [unclassified Arthrobacter]ABK01812.1 hypothetical protein Arth_0411 [Arthrobacter sp. FB24]MBP1233960.1 hypothetical protein [Arthrobacter sp. PvP103]MBP1239094.1 hypothetical protein [Arthrobacter sp. PvP102]
MNNTPRTLNRILIGILGVKLLVIGLLLVLLATVPAVASWWQQWSAGVWSGMSQLLQRTGIPGREESWLWAVIALVLAAVIALMVAWVAQQGKGRANLIVAEDDAAGFPGNVRIGGGVAEQALRAALAGRQDLAGATVATYEIRGEPALKIRLQPRQGVAPHLLAADVSALVEALDAVVGKRIPVLIHIGSGARSRFGRAERVR